MESDASSDADDEQKQSPPSSSRSRSRSSASSDSRSRSPTATQNGNSPPEEAHNDAESNEEGSIKSMSSRGSRRAHITANLEDGNSSDSSLMSDEEVFPGKTDKLETAPLNKDTQPEEISDGDMESDTDKNPKSASPKPKDAPQLDADDLSDVSDLDESIGGASDVEDDAKPPEETMRTSPKPPSSPQQQQTSPELRTDREEGEEQLDFEEEDGECADDKEEAGELPPDKQDRPPPENKELEEGEVSDEDDIRPEEVEPRPVCRFFSRGACTWGSSCRFLHPGVTDKGNYTMFEMIRPVVPGEYRDERAYQRPEPAPMESAWERGLRTAKEMLRKSVKRKEADIDFEDKKKNLSLTQDELDKENGYYMRVPSPEPRYVRHPAMEYPPPQRAPPPDEYYQRRVLYEPEFAHAAPPLPQRERPMRPMYREPPPPHMAMHRGGPPPADYRYDDEPKHHHHPQQQMHHQQHAQQQQQAPHPHQLQQQRRSKREVIVQRVVEERAPRADEWSDPWMRSKSPGARKRAGKRSYSSGSSYSTSSSSRSSSRSSRTSYRSRSRSPAPPPAKMARGGGGPARQAGGAGAPVGRHAVSPSVIVSERKAANERAAAMNPPAPKKKAPSPAMMRAGAQNPPAPAATRLDGKARKAMAAALARVKSRRKSSRSSSASSSASTSSDSDSSSSSSSSREENSPTPTARRSSELAKAMDAAIKATAAEKRPVKMTFKTKKEQLKPTLLEAPVVTAKKRPASPPLSAASDKNSKKASAVTSRREELLKQLKAVEDAIAKKRSKVN